MLRAVPAGSSPPRPGAPVAAVRTERYTSEAFARREVDDIFHRNWLVAGPAWSLPRVGDYFVFEEVGVSVVVLRGADGRLQAFHNSCRHRGASLLRGRGQVAHIDCPYHGWRYGLDGALLQVPVADGFEALTTNRRGLRPVTVDEWAGFAWIHLGADPPPLRTALSGLVEELAPYRLDEMRPVAARDEEMPANWKSMLENAMDFYHVPIVHSRTIQKHVEEVPDLTGFGDHTRQRLHIAPYGWRGRLDAACARGGPYTDRQLSSLHKYLIFPNFLINVLPYHLTVMQVFPLSTGRCKLRYAFCKRRGARGVELARVYATWLASRYILAEDRAILERLQAGMDTNTLDLQPLHRFEAAASHFHGSLDRWLTPSA